MTRTTLIQMTQEELHEYGLTIALEAVKLYVEQQEGKIEMDAFQAADYCGVHVNTIRNWIRNKENPLPARDRDGRGYMIKKIDLDNRLRR